MSIIVGLLPAVFASKTALAQYDSFDLDAAPTTAKPLFVNSLEVGLGYQSRDSFFIGRYGGVTGKGPFLIANGTLDGGDPWDSGDSQFWSAAFSVYGPDTLSFRGRFGNQGRWRASAYYETFERAFSDSALTPFDGIGTPTLTLPSDWRTSIRSDRFSTLEDSLKPLDLKVKWRTVGGDYLFIPLDGYEVRLSFSDRNRKGVRGQSLAFGHEGNFPVGVFFPQPVDYDSNRFTASVAYADQRLQWTAAYTLSVFRNGIKAVNVQNPFARSLGTPWPAGAFAGFPFAVGQYSLPPDSSAHQISLSGGYALTLKTRLRVTLSHTRQKQNDNFLPYTTTPELNVPVPLPRASLNGKVKKTHIRAVLTSRERKDLDFSAHYVFDDRENRSPIDTYAYIANDAQDQPQPFIPGNSRYIRLNLPHSFKFHQVKAEVGYRFSYRTRLSVTYKGDFKSRDNQQVSKTKTHEFKAKVLSTFDTGSVWASLTHSDRNGSEYNDALAWDLSHTDAYLNASPFNQSIEHSLLRKYNMADRTRTQLKASLSLSPTIQSGLSFTGAYSKDGYSNSALGLRRADSLILGSDFTYQLSDQVTATGFYSYEEYGSDQNGYLVFGLNRSNPNQEWRVNITDQIYTVGVTVDWQVRPDELSLGGRYYLSDGTSHTGVQTQDFNILTESAPLPSAQEKTHNIGLHGEYAVRPEMILRAGYTLEWHRSRDWQYDDIGLAPVAQILGSGLLSPRYTAHIGWATVQYQF